MNAETMLDASDQELIDRARRGEADAFSALVKRHQGPLRALIAIELGDGIRGRVEVDDLLQETLLRAFRSIASFEGNTAEAMRLWLSGIAHHAVVDEARRLAAQKHDYRREVALAAPAAGDSGTPARGVLDPPSPAASPSRVLRRKERLERLLEAIHALTPEHRQVVILARIEQLPIKEVAVRMGRSEKAASMLLLRALLALRCVFGETDSVSLPTGFDESISRTVPPEGA